MQIYLLAGALASYSAARPALPLRRAVGTRLAADPLIRPDPSPTAAKANKDLSVYERLAWERTRSGELNTQQLLNEDAAPVQLPPPYWYTRLHDFEYRILRLIQRMPGFLPPSLAVHYSLLPTVITPLLSLLVWLISLPKFASLITMVCAGDCVNTALKWALQRKLKLKFKVRI